MTVWDGARPEENGGSLSPPLSVSLPSVGIEWSSESRRFFFPRGHGSYMSNASGENVGLTVQRERERERDIDGSLTERPATGSLWPDTMRPFSYPPHFPPPFH